MADSGQAIRLSSVCPLSIAVLFPTLLVPQTELLPQFWESTSQMYMAKIQIMQSHYCPQKKGKKQMRIICDQQQGSDIN